MSAFGELFIAPLVGSYHRPPANGVISVLPLGARLRLKPEPDNPYDQQAIQVWVGTEEIPTSQYDRLAEAVDGYGFSLEEILARDEWWLGYIANSPKTGGKKASELCEKATASEMDLEKIEARFGLSADGKPQVQL